MYEKYLEGMSNLKNKGYNSISKCSNNKVRLSGLKMVETVERVGMRGLFLSENNRRLELLTGINTSKNIILNVIYPIINDFQLADDSDYISNKIEELDKIKSNSRYRLNITEMLRDMIRIYENKLISKDRRYGYLKSKSFRNEILYIQGSLSEKKIIAYMNKNKRLNKNN